jgi:hypothetical protein
MPFGTKHAAFFTKLASCLSQIHVSLANFQAAWGTLALKGRFFEYFVKVITSL